MNMVGLSHRAVASLISCKLTSRLSISGLAASFLILSIFATRCVSHLLTCPKYNGPETRELYVATCDTRSGWKEFQALKVWNTSGIELRRRGVRMENVCKGRNWGQHGFLTKPLMYLDYVRRLPKLSSKGGQIIVILMDSDTFWSENDEASIWRKYDCARGSKNILISTEMSCWIGRYCTKDDLHRWYNNTHLTPSYSPFANSGAVIGLASKVQQMLEYVVAHNQSYYTTYFKRKFDDQYAIADYAINVAPQDVALDYHQRLLASFSIHSPAVPYEDGWPFVCKNTTGQISMSCVIWTNLLARKGHFALDKTKCTLGRKLWSKMPLHTEMQTLAPDPIIWHGNGVGKRQYKDYGHDTFKCILRRENMTEAEYLNTFG